MPVPPDLGRRADARQSHPMRASIVLVSAVALLILALAVASARP